MSTDVVTQIRHRIMKLSHDAKSAHAGSALSCVEIMYAALKSYSRKKEVERVVLSKGHAAMVLYACAENLGLLSPSVLDHYLGDNSKLWGHPSITKEFPFIHWSTGSLGHGLSVLCGPAYARKNLGRGDALQVAIISDGECDEGSTWEAALFAGHHKLDRLMAIVDYNKIQSLARCEDVLGLEPFTDKWKSFGWRVEEIDGHDLAQVEAAIARASAHRGSPSCVIAHTVKGKGVAGVENTVLSHYRPITDEQLKKAGVT